VSFKHLHLTKVRPSACRVASRNNPGHTFEAAARSGSKATATNTENGLSITGNISIGFQAIMTATALQLILFQIIGLPSDKYHWRFFASSESRELGQLRYLPSRLSPFERVKHRGRNRAG
jgi:hypothetical protein